MSLEVDSAHQTEFSMKAIRNGYRLFWFHLMKNVSCEYDRRVVETQLCKVRDTSDTLIARCRIVSFCLVISPREVLPLFISLFIWIRTQVRLEGCSSFFFRFAAWTHARASRENEDATTSPGNEVWVADARRICHTSDGLGSILPVT